MGESYTFKCEPIDRETLDVLWGKSPKDDSGKLRISLVPMQIVKDIALVREFGNEKYHDPDNWKQVEKQRYVDALLRHLLEYLEDPKSVDEESGIYHYKHMACNLAFICYMEAQTNDLPF